MYYSSRMDLILIAAAVLPAVLLLIFIERQDRLEKEPRPLLLRLVTRGILATAVAGVVNALGENILDTIFPYGGVVRDALFYYAVVGLCEEGSKYVMLRRTTWNNPEFNCVFDGVVYGAFVSLGFALWENLYYVGRYGLGVAIARAVLSIPGHGCFGVFMGAWYGLAKKYASTPYMDDQARSNRCLRRALLIPALLHGTYDFLATRATEAVTWIFLLFVVAMFVFTLVVVRRMAKNDRYI